VLLEVHFRSCEFFFDPSVLAIIGRPVRSVAIRYAPAIQRTRFVAGEAKCNASLTALTLRY
jgi:hypothetical protein